jgi:hypothetical protein
MRLTLRLSTVHWVATHEDATALDKAIDRTYAWNDRKRRFSPRQVTVALNVLAEKGWLTAAAPG